MRKIEGIKNIVIKIGSASLFKKDEIDYDRLEKLILEILKLKSIGINTIIISSGAIALAKDMLKIDKQRKIDLSYKQALAALGQPKLMEIYNNIGSKYNLLFGQVLVNHDDFEKRERMKHLSNTINQMINSNIIPIINENDTLSVEEIKLGDNDTLASLVSSLFKTDLLVLFSDIKGLYDKDPNLYNDAKLIKTITNIDEVSSFASDSVSGVGTGGMKTKLLCARIVLSKGVKMIICHNEEMVNLESIVKGKEVGSLFIPKENIKSYNHWLIFNTNPKGRIIIDEGLYKQLINKKVSILSKGIIDVKGDFNKNDVVLVVYNNTIVGKGIVNYSSDVVYFTKGKESSVLSSFSKGNKYEIIHADNLVRL